MRAASLLFSASLALKPPSVDGRALFLVSIDSGFVVVLRRVDVGFFSEMPAVATAVPMDSSDSDFACKKLGGAWVVRVSFFSTSGFGGRSRDNIGVAGFSLNAFLTSIFSEDGPVLCNPIRLTNASGTGSDGFGELRDSGRLPSVPVPVFIASFFCKILSLNSSTRLLGCGPPVALKAAFP